MFCPVKYTSLDGYLQLNVETKCRWTIKLEKLMRRVLTFLFLMHSLSTPLKTSENHKVFWCFPGVEKEYIGSKWVKILEKLILSNKIQIFLHKLLDDHDTGISRWNPTDPKKYDVVYYHYIICFHQFSEIIIGCNTTYHTNICQNKENCSVVATFL